MGKGKRLKQQRKFDRQMNQIFDDANTQSKLPPYQEKKFLREYEESGFNMSVFRKWTYLKARKDPNSIDSAIEAGIVQTMKDMNITVLEDGTMVQN